MNISQPLKGDLNTTANVIIPNNEITWDDVFHPSFPKSGSPIESYKEYILEHADESLLFHGICEIPICSPHGAALLLERSYDALERAGSQMALRNSSMSRYQVGSLHKYGADINDQFPSLIAAIGSHLEPFFNLLFTHEDSSTSNTESSHNSLSKLDLYSAHCIAYGVNPSREQSLKRHVDDSKFTATICLGTEGFEGSELVFHGRTILAWSDIADLQTRFSNTGSRRGLGGRDEILELECTPKPGYALLHLGAHSHRTKPIKSGERVSWVLWWHEKNRCV